MNGIERLRAKSLRLTAYMEHLLRADAVLQAAVKILTPSAPEK